MSKVQHSCGNPVLTWIWERVGQMSRELDSSLKLPKHFYKWKILKL